MASAAVAKTGAKTGAKGRAKQESKAAVLTLEQQERELPPLPGEDRQMEVADASWPEGSMLGVGLIDVVGRNRDESEFTAQALGELMRSIAAQGLLQPIVVRPAAEGRFQLIAGQRRLEACKLLGWKQVPAIKREKVTEDVYSLRLAENVQRRELSFDEEADQVGDLIAEVLEKPWDDAAGDQRTAAINRVAQRLGKSPYWVRERMLIDGLDGRTRQLVREGKISVAIARRLAAIEDPADRLEASKKLVERFTDGHTGYRGLPNDREIDGIVGEYLYRLSGVPWKLDEPFASKPACDTCPRNSVNSPGLFTDLTKDGKPLAMFRKGADRSQGVSFEHKPVPKEGVCTLGSCYRHKAAAAKAMIDKAAARAVTTLTQKAEESLKGVRASQREAKTLERAIDMARPAAVKDLVPPGLDPQRVVERAKSKLERQADRGSSRPAAAKPPKVSPEQEKARREAENQARNDWVDFVRRVEDQVMGPVRIALAKDLSKVLLLDLIMSTPAMRNVNQWNAQARRKAMASRETDQALAIVAMPLEKAFAELARLRFGKTGLSTYNPLQLDFGNATATELGLYAKLGKLLGVQVPAVELPEDQHQWIAERSQEILAKQAQPARQTEDSKAAGHAPAPKRGAKAVAPARKSSTNTKAIGTRPDDDEEPPMGAGDVARHNRDNQGDDEEDPS